MIDWIKNLPQGICVGQTSLDHPLTQPSHRPELAGFNLALHVGDDPRRVQQHRISLLQELSVLGAKKLTWLNQTHSTICVEANHTCQFLPSVGDALTTQQSGHVLMIMTADCLPIVLGNAQGTEVANIHAGWRGLADGIIEHTIETMHEPVTWGWLGACISRACFEVGEEVKHIFCQKYAVDFAFSPSVSGKCFADLYAIARYILAQHGIEQVQGGQSCTYQEQNKYYSYRRQAQTGRMASFVFIQA